MGSVAYTNLSEGRAFRTEDPTTPARESRVADESARVGTLVRAVQAARRRRAAFFDDGLFSDPCWDMLLELYALYLEQRRASVSNLYVASCVPASTALRWIAKLEQDGLAMRDEDPLDARRSWIKLTPEGSKRMQRFFEMLPLATVSL